MRTRSPEAAGNGKDPAALLRARGLRVTVQRRAVLQVLLQHGGTHLTADAVHAAVRATLPEVARGTVYKALGELVEAGLAEDIPTGQGARLFGIRLEPHHHAVCDRCQRWFDIPLAAARADPVTPAHLPDGFAPRGVEVLVRGVCRACRESDGSGSDP